PNLSSTTNQEHPSLYEENPLRLQTNGLERRIPPHTSSTSILTSNRQPNFESTTNNFQNTRINRTNRQNNNNTQRQSNPSAINSQNPSPANLLPINPLPANNSINERIYPNLSSTTNQEHPSFYEENPLQGQTNTSAPTSNLQPNSSSSNDLSIRSGIIANVQQNNNTHQQNNNTQRRPNPSARRLLHSSSTPMLTSNRQPNLELTTANILSNARRNRTNRQNNNNTQRQTDPSARRHSSSTSTLTSNLQPSSSSQTQNTSANSHTYNPNNLTRTPNTQGHTNNQNGQERDDEDDIDNSNNNNNTLQTESQTNSNKSIKYYKTVLSHKLKKQINIPPQLNLNPDQSYYSKSGNITNEKFNELFEIIQNSGEGNCLFYALRYFYPDLSTKFLRECVSIFNKNFDINKDYGEYTIGNKIKGEINNDFYDKNYANNILVDGEYANLTDVYLFAYYANIQILLFSKVKTQKLSSSNNYYDVELINCFADNDNIISLYFNGNTDGSHGHFEAVDNKHEENNLNLDYFN
ncbi:MAG: hypothetical protein EBS86_13795, partial [Crocinitomicaceae bacterium]|nr:hypothetical protein [Crocinitomicaceae bacterium]